MAILFWRKREKGNLIARIKEDRQPKPEVIPTAPQPQETVVPVETVPQAQPEGAPPQPAELPHPSAAPLPSPVPPPHPAPPKSKTRKDIEGVLSEGLVALYQTMSPQDQQKFRAAGEEAVGKIDTLVTTFKATARLVLDIIRRWLMVIPGVNKYFLEQESKLKTDRILAIQKQLRREQRKQMKIE